MSELDFWKPYSSQLCETQKQYYYLQMNELLQDEFGYSIDLKGKSVLEIGAGPCGVLLRCHNGRRKIIEPENYPNWVFERYEEQGVEVGRYRVEDMEDTGFDEVWVFNVLQHVDDLDLAIQKIKRSAKVLRIFEYLNQPIDNLHKFTLTKEKLDEGFGINGKFIDWEKPYMYRGLVYYGVYQLESPSEFLIEKFGKHRAMCAFLRKFYLSKVRVGAEVGVLSGDHAELLLKNLCLKKLYLIDPYEEDSWDFQFRSISALQYFREAKEKTEPFRNIVQFIRLNSEEAFHFFRKKGITLDFVYLDGDHSSKVFPKDFENFYQITNFVLGGHDYLTDESEEDWWMQVRHKFPGREKNEVVREMMCIKYEMPRLLRERNIRKLWLGDFPYADWWIEKI